MRNSPLKGIIDYGKWKLDLNKPGGTKIYQQMKNIPTVSSSDISRVTDITKKASKITKIFKYFNPGPAAAFGILSAARELNIKGGRTTDVYKERETGWMEKGKSELS